MFQPAPSPRFSVSISRTPGYRSRTNATVPSLEPLSTTTVSTPASESRHRSIHGRASKVTTTDATGGPCSAMPDLRTRAPAEPLAQHHHGSGEGHEQREQE